MFTIQQDCRDCWESYLLHPGLGCHPSGWSCTGQFVTDHCNDVQFVMLTVVEWHGRKDCCEGHFGQ